MGHTPGNGQRVEPSPRALGRWAQPASRRLASRSARTPGESRREADDRSGRPAAKARAEGLGEGDGDVAAHPGGHPRGQHTGRGDPRRRLPRLSPTGHPHEAAASTARPWASLAREVHIHPASRYGGDGRCERASSRG